jgi:hypothetical protein
MTSKMQDYGNNAISGTWSASSDKLIHHAHAKHSLRDRDSRDSGNTSNSASSSPYWLGALSLSSSPREESNVTRGSSSSSSSGSTNNLPKSDKDSDEVKSALTIALTEKSPFSAVGPATTCTYNKSDVIVEEDDYHQFVTLDETPKDVIFFSPSNFNSSDIYNHSRNGTSANDLLRFKESVGKESNGLYREISTPMDTAILSNSNEYKESNKQLTDQEKVMMIDTTPLEESTTYNDTLLNAGSSTGVDSKVAKVPSNQRLIHMTCEAGTIRVINNDYYNQQSYQKEVKRVNQAGTSLDNLHGNELVNNRLSTLRAEAKYGDECKEYAPHIPHQHHNTNGSHIAATATSRMPLSRPSSQDTLNEYDGDEIWKDCYCYDDIDFEEVESVILRKGTPTRDITHGTSTTNTTISASPNRSSSPVVMKESTSRHLREDTCPNHDKNGNIYNHHHCSSTTCSSMTSTPNRSTTNSPRFAMSHNVDGKTRSMSMMSEASQGEDLQYRLER